VRATTTSPSSSKGDISLRKLKATFASALLMVATVIITAAPASASCREYIEGRCLENDVCAAVSKVYQADCIQ
jgi:hypothetical protein